MDYQTNQAPKKSQVFHLYYVPKLGRSVVEVTKHDTFDKDMPCIKGLFDIRQIN